MPQSADDFRKQSTHRARPYKSGRPGRSGQAAQFPFRPGDVGAITVAEVVDLMEGAHVVAGGEGLHRTVRSIGVLESPDSAMFIKAGDLLLSALYAIRQDHDAQVGLISHLHDRGAAGLATKRSFIGDLPEAMLAEADRLKLPLMLLPEEAAFSDVMAPIFGKIVNRQSTVLQRQQLIYKMMIDSLLEQRGLEALARSLSEVLSRGVAICDPSHRVLAHGLGPHMPEANAETLFEELCHARVDSRKPVFSLAGARYELERISTANGRRTRVVTKVAMGDHDYGRLVVFQGEDGLTDLDFMALDTATAIIALELSNRQALLEVERRYRNEFAAALFSDPIETAEHLIERGRLFSLELTRPHYAVCIQAAESPGVPSRVESSAEQLYAAIEDEAGGEALVAKTGTGVTVIKPGPSEPSSSDGAATRSPWVDEFHRRLMQLMPEGDFYVGVGSPGTGVEGIRSSFREARRAARVARRVWGPGKLLYFHELGVFQILDAAVDSAHMGGFLEGVKSLVEYDQARNTGLVETLETFFDCNGSVRKVADTLFLHYNTVLYRLKRIQEITGMDLKDADARLHLQVAAKAARLAGIIPGQDAPVNTDT